MVLRSPLPAVSTTLSALTITTWSPVSRWGANVGLCLPRSTRATSVARRPRTMPSASTTYQARWISEALGLYVGTRATFMEELARAGDLRHGTALRATNKPTGTRRETASWSGDPHPVDERGRPRRPASELRGPR